MKHNIVFKDGRPQVVAGEKHPQEGGMLVEVPEDFNIRRAEDWRLENGELVYDPLPAVEKPEAVPEVTLEERVAKLEEELQALRRSLDKRGTGENFAITLDEEIV